MRLLIIAFLALLALATAQTVCLSGQIELTQTASAAAETFCNGTQCTLLFELSFDPTTADSSRWPLRVALQDGTTLAERWPELDSVSLQCNTAGDVIASTRFAGAGEHLRLIWTYAGADSVMCSYTLQTVDWAADFVSAQALFVYGADEAVGSADALWYTTAADYSLASETVVCPVEPAATTGAATGEPTTDSTTGSTYVPDVLGECRYPRAVWQTSRRDAPQWRALGDAAFCDIPVADLVMGSGAALDLPTSFGALAAEVGVAMLNAAMYTRTLAEVNETFVQYAYDVVNTPLNCATAHDYAGLIQDLAAYSNSTTTCTGGSACPITKADLEYVEKKAVSKAEGYLIGLIICAIAAGVFLIIIIALLFYIFYDVGFVHRGRVPTPMGGTVGYLPASQTGASDGMQA